MNLGLSLLYAAERTPDADAVVDGADRLDYQDLQRVAARVAAGLASLGVGGGDRVALVLKNRREAVELYWACQWLGAVVVPLSWRVAPADVAYCVADSGATVVAFEEVGLEHARACSDAADRFVAVGTRGTGSSADLAARFCAGGEAKPCEPYESLLAAGEAAGAPAAMVEPHPHRRDMAQELGADAAFDPLEGSLEEQVLEFTQGRGASLVVECSGNDAARAATLDVVGFRGRIVIIGIRANRTVPLELDKFVFKEVTMAGSDGSGFVFAKPLELMSRRVVDFSKVITHRFPLEEVNQALELGAGQGESSKIMIVP